MLVQMYKGHLPVIVKGGFNWVDVRDVCNAVVRVLSSKLRNEKIMLSGHHQTLYQIAAWVGEFREKKYVGRAIPIWIAKVGLPFVHFYSICTKTQALYSKALLKAI